VRCGIDFRERERAVALLLPADVEATLRYVRFEGRDATTAVKPSSSKPLCPISR